MKTKMVLKIILMGCVILGVFRLLRGHDLLTGLAVISLFVWAVASLVLALISRRKGNSGSGNTGYNPPLAPKPVSPKRPRSPEFAEVRD
jgi:hypothetical protein